jgi:hypothetical protein
VRPEEVFGSGCGGECGGEEARCAQADAAAARAQTDHRLVRRHAPIENRQAGLGRIPNARHWTESKL